MVLYKNCRSEVANPFLEGADLHFGGCQFAFWRLKLSWGCFKEKGGGPKKGGTLGSRNWTKFRKILPESRHALSHRLSSNGKGKPALRLVATVSAGCLLKVMATAFSSFLIAPDLTSEGRGRLEEGCLVLPGVFPDIS